MKAARIAAPLLLAAVLSAPAAAAADPLTPPAEHLIAPAPTGFFLWQRTANVIATSGQARLWPDATVRFVLETSNYASEPPGPGYTLAYDPLAGGPITTEADQPVPTGSLWGQKVTLLLDTYDIANRGVDAALVGVGGRAWTVENAQDGAETTALVARDERLVPRRSRYRPVGGAVGLFATTRGLRILAGAGRRSVRILDGRLRWVAGAATEPTDPVSAVTTGAGHLLLVTSRSVLRLDGRGRLRDVGGPLGPGRAGARPWSQGHVGLGTMPDGGLLLGIGRGVGRDEVPALARTNSLGRVTKVRDLDDLGLPFLHPCTSAGGHVSLDDASVDSTGRPVVLARCIPADASAVQESLAVELGTDLAPRQVLFRGTNAERATLLGSQPDGRFAVARAPDRFVDGPSYAISAIDVPGAVVTRGRARLLGRGSAGRARVRLTCRRPAGTVCSGVLTLRAAGRVLGWAPYALPGRPGKIAAVFDRTVRLEAGLRDGLLRRGRLPKGSRVRLGPLPAQLDRTAIDPPRSPAP